MMRRIALVVVVAVLGGMVGVRIAPPAAAATPPDVTALVDVLDGPSNSLRTWTGGLGSIGKLAESLPAVQASPGAVLGFPDLLHRWFTSGGAQLAGATTEGGLNVDESIDLGGSDGRTGHLTSALTTLGNGDKQLNLTIVAAKTVHDQGLSVAVPVGAASNAPQSALTSTGGVDLTVTGSLSFQLVWDSVSGHVHLVANGTTPSITIDASASIANVPAVKASIGILGVSLASGSTLSLSAHLTAALSDPNNDGRLAFTNTDGTSGELAQAGSLAGLVSFGFSSPAGALQAHLLLTASASASSIPLPAVSGTVDVAWPDISTGAPTVTPTGIDAAGKFLNMTPRDLADGIAQLATTLTSIQHTRFGTLGDLDLPFLKGSLADAVQLNESIKQFLKDNTIDPAVDPSQAGHPTFVSIQELLDRLNAATAAGGVTIDVSDVHYVDPKLDFKISLKRPEPLAPLDLSTTAAAASGGAGSTYGNALLTDTSQHWKADEFAGRTVVAGSSGATVSSNTANTLTLAVPAHPSAPGQAWAPAVPAAGSPYTISGVAGNIGAVQLGNGLQTGGQGVAQANAVNATAKVKPKYDASITLVLDLENPVLHNPPLAVPNGDGTTHLVDATPTGADRVLLRTGLPLFTADFPMDAGVDLFANAGFLQVEMKGAVHICEKNAAADCSGAPPSGEHMLTVGLKDQGDLNFGQVVHGLLSAPGDLLSFGTNVRAVGSVTASVPNAPDFFPSAASATFHWDDITTGAPAFDLSGLDALTQLDFSPQNPKQLFSIILKTLQTLDKAIGEADPSDPAAAVFSRKIPLVGRSMRDLLRSDESGMGTKITYGSNTLTDASRTVANGRAFPAGLVGRSVVAGTQIGIVKAVSEGQLTMVSSWATQPAAGTAYVVRSELDDIISILQTTPSDNLQALLKMVNDRLGHDTPLSFAFASDAKVGGIPSLVIKLDWKRSFHTSAPVQFDFNLPVGSQSLAGVQGSGLVSLAAGGDIKLGLVVPLVAGTGPADASALKITDDSSIGVKLATTVDDASIATTIGPLSLALGDPTSPDKAKAKASYSIDLAKAGGDGTAVSFADFMGGVAPAVNASSDPVDCGLADASTPLAMCASLPLYISNDGTHYTKLIDPGANAFSLRLPKAAADGPLDLSGAQVDGHDRLETPDATALADAIANHLIDLKRIDGIDGFLDMLVQSLNAASFGGKLPLVGNDLQQGADFLGELKQTIDSAIGGLATVDSISGLRDWVNTNLAAKLTAAHLNPDLVKVDTQCKSLLDSAAAPTVTPSDVTGTHTLTYAIVTYVKDSSGNQHDAMPGPDGQTTVSGFTATDATHTVGLSWAAVTGAAGYKVYRSDGGGLKLLKDVAAATTYTDLGADAAGPAPANPAGPNPNLTDCNFSDFDSVIIRLDVSQGSFAGADDVMVCDGVPAGHECLTKTVPLNIGIPGLSLRAADPSQGPSVQIGWRLHLAFGISRSQGFFVDTEDGDPQPELAVGLNFTLPAAMNAQLAIVNISAQNCTNDMTTDCKADAPAPGSVPPLFGGTFKIDLTSPHADGRLTLSDLSGASLDDLFKVKLSAGVHIDWLLKATVGDGAGFPGIQAELRLAWQWSNADPGSNAGGLTIDFDKVQIDAGAAFSAVIGPIIKEIKKVTGPLDPIIKTLYAPIPVLSDLSHLVGGDDVTLISIAKAFSTFAGGPDLTFVDRITRVITIINSLPVGSNVLIPIGDFSLAGASALDTTATPDNTDSLIKPGSEALDAGASGSGGVLGSLDTSDGNGKHIMQGAGAPAESPTAKAGFEFPVFQHPSSLFNLLLGADVTLVTFDSGPLTLGFDWRQEFGPVYAPPPVLITLHGSASVTLHIKAGFDTFGIRKAVEAERAGTLTAGDVGDAILQSLFFSTVDDDGKPLPVVSFNGELAAGAEVSAVIIKVGIEGGVGLTISFLWNDPNHDGKFRISEFLHAALNNPICLFSVSGRMYVFLKLFVEIGFSPFSVSFSFTIVDVTLLDFSATPDCAPPPPKLGALGDSGKTLVVYAAAFGHAQRGDASYDSTNEDKDTVKITSLHDYDQAGAPFKGVGVEMLGIRNEFLNSSIERVVVLGTGYSKPMSVTFLGDGKEDLAKTGAKPPTSSFEKDAIVFGGNSNDVIKTGIGTSWVDGGPGDDVVVTGDRTVLNADKTDYLRPDAKSWVTGGGGKDSITVGNGTDLVAGDGTLGGGGLKTLSDLKELKNSGDPSVNVESGDPTETTGSLQVPDWTSIPAPNAAEHSEDDRDVVSVGLGQDSVFGNGGSDTLSVGVDNPLAKSRPAQAAMFTSRGVTLVGGNGSDHFASGSGDDTIFTAGQSATAIDGSGAADAAAPGDPAGPAVNIVDTGTGSDTVHGGAAIDRVAGHSTNTQHDDIRGGAGEDILVGGFGADHVYGGPGNDYVIAEPSTVDLGTGTPPDAGFGPEYTVVHTPLPAGVSSSLKTLVGGAGNDHIIGGDGGANVDGDGYNPVTRCGPGAVVASDPVDGGAAGDGNDKIIGGAGVENVRAGGGGDYVDVKAADDLACGEHGNDTLLGGAGSDQAWGGSDQDTVYGDAGADKLYGNDANDTIYGGEGADAIEGNNGSDQLFGGADADAIVGGTQLAGRADQGDVLYGDTGTDVLIGDNGVPDGLGGGTPFDLGSGNASLGAADLIFGGAADDHAYGGLGDDFVLGGTQDDYIEGNNGADHLYGEADQDDIIGGTSQQVSGSGLAIVGYPDAGDSISGGGEQDVVLGDNGSVTRPGPGNGSDFTQGRGMTERLVTPYDWAPAGPTVFGADTINGDGGNDVVLAEGGGDAIHGDAGDDYIEGNQGADSAFGDDGQDDILGGSSQVANAAPSASLTAAGESDTGDAVLSGGDGQDVLLGDDGFVLRTLPTPASTVTGTLEDTTKGHAGMTQRRINLYDVQDNAVAANSGADVVTGDAGDDVAFGQGGNDRMSGASGDDHLEGGQGADFAEGDTGDDDIIGGTSVILSGTNDAARGVLDAGDVLFGGDGNDLVAGDDAVQLRVGGGADASYTSKFTNRLAPGGAGVIASRWFRRLDLAVGAAGFLGDPAGRYGPDRISGGKGTDAIFGQDGNDLLSGGPDDDYIEGGGGSDVLRGDLTLAATAPTNAFPPVAPGTADLTVSESQVPVLVDSWVGTAGSPTDLEGPAGTDGQDDLIGGSSLQGFRDGDDTIEGDGATDFQLGDNGALVRDYSGPVAGLYRYTLSTARYPSGAVPADAAVIRHHDPSIAGMATTRFCVSTGTTCEPTGASGSDTMYGDTGDDTMWGQDANDTMRGGTGNDDMYGELGNDTIYGDGGQDAVLGDRGGIVDTYINASGNPPFAAPYTVSVQAPPAISYSAFTPGTYDRRVDQLHDIDGVSFVGSGATNVMAHDGATQGGDDHIRGGAGHDSIHAGFGDDVVNGDSGGDTVFGDDGADVLWGGKGCDPQSPEDSDGACVDPSSVRGAGDRYVDYLFGGKGGTSVASQKGDAGSDIMDWQPRGSYPAGCSASPWPQTVSASVTNDPCDWFLMTKTYNDAGTTTDLSRRDNQTHHGVDWMYGGWDRDVMQADQASEGPNTGDRLLDWSGAYNLYSHCNPSYGGFNDVRELSPAELAFVQRWSYGVGVGQTLNDVTTAGTSAFDEAAIVYQSDLKVHGAGAAYPTTPGHFDAPNACSY